MPIQQFSKLEFCEDFGDGPLLLAHVITDRSAIAVVSLLGGFVAQAMGDRLRKHGSLSRGKKA